MRCVKNKALVSECGCRDCLVFDISHSLASQSIVQTLLPLSLMKCCGYLQGSEYVHWTLLNILLSTRKWGTDLSLLATGHQGPLAGQLMPQCPKPCYVLLSHQDLKDRHCFRDLSCEYNLFCGDFPAAFQRAGVWQHDVSSQSEASQTSIHNEGVFISHTYSRPTFLSDLGSFFYSKVFCSLCLFPGRRQWEWTQSQSGVLSCPAACLWEGIGINAAEEGVR